MAPDLERLKSLLELPVPISALQRSMGIYTHYSPCVTAFSEKIHSLTEITNFPVPLPAFKGLKRDITSFAITAVDPSIPLVAETDTSDCGAFFSRTLSRSERRHLTIEKEAYATVEALKK